jgi:hypothetical protein
MIYKVSDVNKIDMFFRIAKQLTIILQLIGTPSNKKLGKWLTSLECADYNYIVNYLMTDNSLSIYKLKYKSHTYINNIIPTLQRMKKIVQNSYYKKVY